MVNLLKYNASGRVSMNLKFADSIRVSAWDKDEIQIKASILINNGKLNEAFTMKVDKSGGELDIITDFDMKLMKEGKGEDCNGYIYQNKGGELAQWKYDLL